MVITLGPLLAFLYLAGSFNQRIARYYGPLKHEVVFDPSNLTNAEVDQIGYALNSAGFFDDVQTKSVDAEKTDERFIITIYSNESARDTEFLELCKTLRSDVQKSFPTNPIVIDVVIDTPQNRIARLE